MDWETIGTSVITSGLFSGLIFLWLNHRLTSERAVRDHEYQKERDKLKNDFLIQMEAMRTELNRVSANQQFQFTKLHEDRANAILELHKQMVKIKGYVYQASKAKPGSEEHITFLEKALENWDEFDKCYVRDMIYFKPSLCNELANFIDIGRWLIAHQAGEEHRPSEPLNEDEKRVVEERDSQWKKLEKDSYLIAMKIMREFRLLLGMAPEELDEGIDHNK